ncbi:hypothetical protein GCM10027613_02720 [Microlunatus endophyticus]
MLALLSGFIAEFLLGDQYLSGFEPAAEQVASFILFVAFYGMAAVLIHELARRLRLGWTGILLLALGYGIFEEGLITQSLFNPHYLGLSLIQPGYVPMLGIGAPWTIFVISLHVVWSISAPIAITEAWYGRDDPEHVVRPWLGRVGIVVCLVIFVLAAAATAAFSIASDPHRFVAPPARLIITALAVGTAVVLAVRLRGRQPPPVQPTVRATVISAALVVVAAGLFESTDKLSGLSPWLRTAIVAALWLVMLVILSGWSRRGSTVVPPGPAPFGLAAGAVITYCWVGLVSAVSAGPAGIAEQSVLVIIALAIVAWTARRSLQSSAPRSRPAQSPALS